MKSLDSTAEIKICDKTTKDVIGVCYVKLRDYQDQIKTEKVFDLKPLSGPEFMGSLRLRIRVLWSKLNFFNSQIVNAEEKLEMANKESQEVSQYLNLLNEPFGIITYGQIENIMENDILEPPKEKEEIVHKQRMSILPQAQRANLTNKDSFANKIDQAFRGTLSMPYFLLLQKLM